MGPGCSTRDRLGHRPNSLQCRLKLNVALMHRLCFEGALDDHVGFSEAFVDVACRKLVALDHICRLIGVRTFRALRPQVVMQYRGVRSHRLDRSITWGSTSYSTSMSFSAFFARLRGCGYRGYGMSFPVDLLSGHCHSAHIAGAVPCIISGKSSRVMIAFTPGSFEAFVVSMRFRRA